jgi:glycosyltransferase involved in cell wall biosynthesis
LWLIKGLGPGGAEQLLLLSAGVADHAAFDYRIAYLRADKTHLVPEFEQLGLIPHRLGSDRRGRFGWIAGLRDALNGVDVVHAHSPVLAGIVRLLSLSLPASHRPAVVTTEHNEWTSHRLPTRLLNGLTSPLDAQAWAVSQQVRETVWPWRRGAFEVLIHGIDTTAPAPPATSRPEVRRALGIADDQVLAITVANLRRNKDYPNLLRAARLAAAEEPRLRFVAVGQGPLQAEIAALHEGLGLGGTLQLLGFRRDVSELMDAADLMVMASAHEGLPVAIMEAFAHGLPVVATAVGGVPQAISDGVQGHLVPPGDSEALAHAVVAVARDDDRRRAMGEAARRRAADYDIRHAVAVQQERYRTLVRRRTR